MHRVGSGLLDYVDDTAAGAKAQAPEPPHDYSGKGGLMGRLFPDRDPNTGAQGGILANPLFRLGLNLLARSGPQARPHSLGQDIAGSINDYAGQRDQETIGADNALSMFTKRQGWNDLQGKIEFAKDFDPEELMKIGVNPSGEDSALKAQAGTPTIGAASPNYQRNVMGLESAGGTMLTSDKSSASGPYHFIDGTRKWIDQTAGFNPSDRSFEADGKRFEFFTGNNAKYLTQTGIPVNDTSLYASHLLGSAGAVRFYEALKANPNTPAEAAIDQKQVNANTEVLKGKTVSQVHDLIERSIAKGAWDHRPESPQFSSDPNAQGLSQPPPSMQPPVAPPLQLPVAPGQAPQQEPPPAPQQMMPLAPRPAPAQFPPSPGAPPQASLPPVAGPTPVGLPPAPAGGAALPSTAVSTPATGGPVTGPGGPVTEPAPGPQIPEGILQPNAKGGLTKASIMKALEGLPPEVRNATIVGSWMKASGNKREFAENLGEALLSFSSRADQLRVAEKLRVGSRAERGYQYKEMMTPEGRKVGAAWDSDTGQAYEPDGKGGLKRLPAGTTPTTAGAAGPLSQMNFKKIAQQIDDDNIGLQKLDKYMTNVGNSAVGVAQFANSIATSVKTLLDTGGLTPQQLSAAIATGDLQTLVGLMKIDIVGPGVMTAQDAIYIMRALGGDVDMWMNPEVVRERLSLMVEQKQARMRSDVEAYNANAKYYDPAYGTRSVQQIDTEKWKTLPNMDKAKKNAPSKYKIEVVP